MTPTTTTPPARPFLLPALINPYVQPVASRSTPGLLHMVIRWEDTESGNRYWCCTGAQRPHNGPHCRPGCCHIVAVKEQLEREETHGR